MNRKRVIGTAVLSAALVFAGSHFGRLGQAEGAGPAGTLLSDGDFEQDATGKQLRAQEHPQGWYESRDDGPQGRKLLTLSKKVVAGNSSKKARIKGDPKLNTYLSQAFSQPQNGRFSLKWDILVKEIAATPNRSAFQLIGDDSVKGKGTNATASERFAFLGFENAAQKGKINLFAFEGGGADPLAKRTPIASNLDLGRWYTVRVDLDPAAQSYTVSVSGASSAQVAVHAFQAAGKAAPKSLTHVSFASWNDGPGTFYIDNVGQP